MKFLLRKDFNGKNLFGMSVSIEAGTYLESDNKYILFNRLPIFAIRSEMAKNVCVWADDGHEQERLLYELVIVFNTRIKEWTEKVPVYDDSGKITKYEEVTITGRFTPREVKYIRANFSNLLTDDENTIRFNDYFYVGSNINEIYNLYIYLM